MKAKLIATVLCVCFAGSLLAACGQKNETVEQPKAKEAEAVEEEASVEAEQEEASASEETSAPEETAEVEDVNYELTGFKKDYLMTGGAGFEDFLNFVQKGLDSKWEESDPADLGLSQVYTYNSEYLGYAIIDIDKDGKDELIIGENIGDNGTDIYDIFTIDKDGNCQHIACGGERDVYHVNGQLIYEIASSAGNDTIASAYIIDDAQLAEVVNVDVESLTADVIELTLFN